jgi:hypothetical protein
LEQAISNGCVLLAAAGNDGGSSADYFPGNCVGVIAVEASTKAGLLASYSNNRGTLAAPGGDALNPIVTVSLDSTASFLVAVASMGTSFSVPMVAGFMALGIDMYGPTFNLGNTLNPFADNCTTALCGAGIVSFYGTAHAVLVVPEAAANATPYYQCSWNGSETHIDTVYWLNTTDSEWHTHTVACIDARVHQAYECFNGYYMGYFMGTATGCNLCEPGYYCAADIRVPCPNGYYCQGGWQASPYSYPWTTCAPGTHVTTLPTTTRDRECTTWSTCSPGLYPIIKGKPKPYYGIP